MRTESRDSLAVLLRGYRQAAGWSQEELSARSGLSARAIGMIEAGRTRRPYPRSVRVLADALGLAAADRAALLRAAGLGGTDPGGQSQSASVPLPKTEVTAQRPAELPPDIGEFTGRSEQVGQLVKLLGAASRAGPMPVAIITGAGGSGKSTLAVHVAHQLRRDYPDGQFFLELRGSGHQPVTTADALARMLRQLGMADNEQPADAAERAAVFRTRLADRRMLLVFDDARDAAQIRLLLPGTASSAVLVTSRNWLADLAGGQHVVLGELAPGEALALFSRVCGDERVAAEPAATSAVLAACAGLPLAVRIAAARLVSRPRWKIRTLAARLSDQRRRLEELSVGDLAVRASFQVSYATLPAGSDSAAGDGGDDCGRAFRLLGLWPGPDISLPAVSALLGTSTDTAFRTLEKLVDVHMLQAHGHSRYRFHDLIGAFAVECAKAQESPLTAELAIRRLLSWFTHTAAGALESLELPPLRQFALARIETGVRPLTFADRFAAADWADSERANLSAAVVLAASLGLHAACAELTEVIWRCQLRTPWDGWLGVLDRGIESAAATGNYATRAWLLNYLGIVLLYRGESAAAHARLTEAVRTARLAGEARCEAAGTGNLAIACKELRRYDEAIAHFERADRIEPDPSPRRKGTTLMNLGMLQVEVGRLADGIVSMEQGLALLNGRGEHFGDALARSLLADAYRQLGRYSLAFASARTALEISEQARDRYAESAALRALGMTHADVGDYRQARYFLASAHALSADLGLPETEQIATIIATLGPEG
jgi:tetratricopeptide (TPR) repeat protein/transcriptional regulator with XRE-family HTH domain